MEQHRSILMWAAQLWIFAQGMLGPLFAVFAERIGGDIFDITWAWGLYLIVTGLLTMIVGRLSDRHSKEWIMITGYALSALFTFAYLLVDTPWKLFVVQIGLGVATAIANPPWYALYSQYTDPKSGGKSWGTYTGYREISRGVALIAGGFVVSLWSFDALFIIMGTIQAAAAVYQARIIAL